MRAMLAVLVAAAALAAASSASAAPTVCAFKSGQILAVIANGTPTFCRLFNSTWGGVPFHGHFGTLRCAWVSYQASNRMMGFLTADAVLGRVFCARMARSSAIRQNWIRVR